MNQVQLISFNGAQNNILLFPEVTKCGLIEKIKKKLVKNGNKQKTIHVSIQRFLQTYVSSFIEILILLHSF